MHLFIYQRLQGTQTLLLPWATSTCAFIHPWISLTMVIPSSLNFTWHKETESTSTRSTKKLVKLKVEQYDTHKKGIVQRIKSLQQNLPPFYNNDTIFLMYFLTTLKQFHKVFNYVPIWQNTLVMCFPYLGP